MDRDGPQHVAFAANHKVFRPIERSNLMSYIAITSETEATGKLQRLYEAAIQRTGRVANIIKMMSLDADIAQASMQFYVALMKSPNALSAARREMLAAVVSNYNDCYY